MLVKNREAVTQQISQSGSPATRRCSVLLPSAFLPSAPHAGAARSTFNKIPRLATAPFPLYPVSLPPWVATARQ